MQIQDVDHRLAGYAYVLEKLAITGIPNWHRSAVATSGTHSVTRQDGFVDEVFRAQYWPGETIGAHLEFALKYDGVNLALLAKIFEKVAMQELVEFIKSKPTGKYVRRIWFFYEFLTEKRLPIDDMTTSNYVDALEAKDYYTVQKGERSPRHRVVNNLLGPRTFCPVVRKTERLLELDSASLQKRCEEIVTDYPPQLLRHALRSLYTIEAKSSFEIEHSTSNASRTEKFIASLQLAEKEDFCEKARLIELQNRIVDPRFRDSDYRLSQQYVGQSIAYQKEIIHYICPKPDDLPSLMEGLLASHARMKTGGIPPVVHAAVIAYGFVFLHPFEDGNGRVHRFLIHNILSMQNMVPRGLMLPVSAVMLKNPDAYDRSLEAFSRPLLQVIDYSMDAMGRMTVESESACWYSYMDMTAQAEALSEFILKTIEEELVQELNSLANYDTTKQAIQNIIDMPDRLIDLFIHVCLQNNASLSEKKRTAYFDFLSDEELKAMEQAVRDSYKQA